MKQGSLSKIAAYLIAAFLLVTALHGFQPQQIGVTTIEAVLGELYPAMVLGAQEELSVYVRVEGQDSTVWRGDVIVSESDITADNSGTTYHLWDPTALGALDEASNHEERFQYYVTDQYGALFVSSVDGEESRGASGWMYRVNYYLPNIGAGQFMLGETIPPNLPHSEALWYYGGSGELPLKISLDKAEIDVGEQFTAMVTQYSDATHAWSSCEGATVYIDNEAYPDLTGSDGMVNISIDSEGTFDIFAEKDGCIRSGRIELTVTPRAVTYTLTMEVNGNGSTIPSVGSHTYDAGTVVDISATPDTGWEFNSWSGGVTNPSSSSTTVTIDADKSVIANFIEISPVIYTLTLTCEPNGGGSLTLSPTAEGNQYEAGTSVELTATPADGYVFDTWSGDLNGSTNPASVSMDSDKEVIANFVLPASEKPGDSSVSNLNISPEQVQPNQQVDITINVANNGEKVGSYEGILYVNGQIEANQTVNISPGSTQTVVFSVTKAIPGTYTVSLGGQQGQFTVVGGQASGGGLDIGSTIAIVIIIVLVAALVLVFRRIRKKA